MPSRITLNCKLMRINNNTWTHDRCNCMSLLDNYAQTAELRALVNIACDCVEFIKFLFFLVPVCLCLSLFPSLHFVSLSFFLLLYLFASFSLSICVSLSLFVFCFCLSVCLSFLIFILCGCLFYFYYSLCKTNKQN